jgi:antitoxin component YwqK of YwqJK toxin-antitoxin module
MRDGKCTYFYDGGSVNVNSYYVSQFAAGIQEGEEVGYFPSGKVRYRGEYKGGHSVGTWTWFNEDGTVKDTKDYPTK